MQIIANRYQLITTVGQGNMGAVYRCVDKLTGGTVALKRVLIGKDLGFSATVSQNTNARTALIQEFKMLATLRHPNIISVLDYGFDDERVPFFTMNWLENADYFVSACQKVPIEQKLDLITQMLQALMYLHRRGIIHRDIKPTNVLVQDGVVKVLDFGLATGDTASQSDESVVGTLQYISPEILRGDGASFASDLYAVGLMLYEVFANSSPYQANTITQLISDIMNTPVDTTQLDVSVELQILIADLLEKLPQDRPASADAVLQRLNIMRGIQQLPESASVRDSFLQGANFVGRQAELARLTVALDDVIETTQGVLWLIGGESGIGKSRLIEELRVYALVQGVHVLRGQAVSEGGAPYLLWRDILRYLVIQTDISDLDAAILKPLVPDIDNLVGRSIPDAPEVDPKIAQQRILKTIISLIHRQKDPLLLILEDIHWAREGISVLEALAKDLPQNPLLIIASYRQDEAPHLAELFADSRILKLDRFSRDVIQQLAISMLGIEIGSQPALIDLLQRESEGNIFFIIEIIRALAEQVGQLARIGDWLPQSIYAGGIQKVIERRLAGVSASAIPLLNLSAIAGRELDLTLLAHLSPQTDLTQWLAENNDLGILEAQESRWRFSHDKLREGLVQNLAPSDYQALQQQVAQGLLTVYADEAQPARLAYHYTEAGDSQQAAHWLILAGEQALRAGALETALDFFHQTIAQQEQFSAPKHHLSRTYRLIGRTYFGMGKVQESGQAVQQALKLCHIHIPKSQLGLWRGILWQGGKQALFQTGIIKPRKGDTDVLLESLKASILMSVNFGWSGGQLRTNYLGIIGLNLSDRLYPADITATSYSGMGYFLSLIPMHRLADYYLNKALRVTENTPNANLRLDTQYSQGLMMIHRGEFKPAMKLFLSAAAQARQINDDQRWLVLYSQHIAILYLLADYEMLMPALDTVEVVARTQNNLQYIVWSTAPRGYLYARRGEYADAIAMMCDAEELLRQGKDMLAKIFVQGGLALAYLYDGQHDQAETVVNDLFRRTYKKRPFGHAVLEGYPAVVEVYTALSLLTDDPTKRKKFAERAKQGMQTLTRYAKIFAFAQARLWLWRGIYLTLIGKQTQAEQAWKKSLMFAKQYAMVLDEALACRFLGLLPNHLTEKENADAIFARLNVKIPISPVILTRIMGQNY